jgi:hypothetical protein
MDKETRVGTRKLFLCQGEVRGKGKRMLMDNKTVGLGKQRGGGGLDKVMKRIEESKKQ